ncbi:MULE domain-containing protein [Abeliophyllum distichum]|uniref:MULE domain-containing protein n=1 Tax=Abeliophyllum distichum TaxID=126358 RepID=A0ABD1PPD7_9LAMI
MGDFGGYVLAIVGIDGENAMYPIAYAIVEVENKSRWNWFLELLVDDIGVGDSQWWISISDKQKDLVDTLDKWTTCSYRRFQLTEIQCCHAMCCIQSRNMKLENYVDECYSKETFLNAYNSFIHPMAGPEFWAGNGKKPMAPPHH